MKRLFLLVLFMMCLSGLQNGFANDDSNQNGLANDDSNQSPPVSEYMLAGSGIYLNQDSGKSNEWKQSCLKRCSNDYSSVQNNCYKWPTAHHKSLGDCLEAAAEQYKYCTDMCNR